MLRIKDTHKERSARELLTNGQSRARLTFATAAKKISMSYENIRGQQANVLAMTVAVRGYLNPTKVSRLPFCEGFVIRIMERTERTNYSTMLPILKACNPNLGGVSEQSTPHLLTPHRAI